MIPVVIVVTALIHLMVWALPGDPFAGRCGDRPCPPTYVAQMTEQFNLDKPWPIQYLTYLGNLFTGDFGRSFRGDEVADALARAYPVTLKLALMAIAIEVLIGITAGILAALRKGELVDSLVLVCTLFVISIPVFVIGSTVQLFFGIRFGWFPPTVDEGSFSELLMPAFVLASVSLAYVSRLMRTNLVENLRADYVRTASAKGMRRSRVIGVHTVRNSLIPVITFIGFDLGALMGGSIVVEGIFSINGVGGLIFNNIQSRDGAMVVGAVTVLVLVFLFVNLLVDLLYAVLDPRIRYD
jgi:oligopeptide transport system permease protein